MHENYSDEIVYLDETLSYLNEQIAIAKAEIIKDEETLQNSQDDNNKDMIYVEDIYDLINVTADEAEVAQARYLLDSSIDTLARYEIQRYSPYFGRVDIKHIGESEYDKIYIGRFSLLDADTYRAIVYDWRAPISSVYYEDIGDVRYLAPNGEQSGDVNLKRQFKIEDGELQYLFDAEVAVNDEMLARVLAQSSGDRLKVIINTIQREQNTAIRHIGGDALIVFGPAGSGKTSVGMHRLAWLLYSEREKLTAKNCLIISSSTVFSSYIADVLPDLGEERVESVVFDKLFEIDGYHEQIAYVSGASPGDRRMENIRIKYSEDFMDYVRIYFEQFDFNCEDIIFYDELICSSSELKKLAVDGNRRFTFPTAYNRIVSHIETCCDEYFMINKNMIMKRISDDSDEYLLASEVTEIYNATQKQFIAEKLSKFHEDNILDDIFQLYRKILRAYMVSRGMAPRNPGGFYEDQIVMCYIAALSGMIEAKNSVTQVLLDEAQDYSPMHIALLRQLFPKSKFTVLADTQQAIYQDITITDPDLLVSLFPGAYTMQLKHSYRCTKEIFEFACHFIGKIPADSHTRSGDLPEVIKGDTKATILEILAKDSVSEGTVAIISRTTLEARDIHKKIGENIQANLISKPDSRLTGGVTVLPMYFVKGLEFDTVILVNCEKPNEPLGDNLMYTLCTRALHRLYLIIDE
ncbi:MAG: UvrD-helicase domain-containing protein [Oscillospiraceae bacterium]|nr:UvrD-helicase domain-containing protein [Oscillospiraceae bacterium]